MSSQAEEVFASIRIDNKLAGSTKSRMLGLFSSFFGRFYLIFLGPNCWDQHFSIDLDRAKELEIELFYKDKRQMCAFAVLKLGNYKGNLGKNLLNF
jgi:protein kinase N